MASMHIILKRITKECLVNWHKILKVLICEEESLLIQAQFTRSHIISKSILLFFVMCCPSIVINKHLLMGLLIRIVWITHGSYKVHVLTNLHVFLGLWMQMRINFNYIMHVNWVCVSTIYWSSIFIYVHCYAHSFNLYKNCFNSDNILVLVWFFCVQEKFIWTQ